jgi:hypothetical protein
MNYLKIKVNNINQQGSGKSTVPHINYNNQLFIFNDFFSNTNFNKIKNIVKNLDFKKDNRVTERKTLCLDANQFSELYNIVYNNPKIKSIINDINSKEFNNPPRFPMEYRIYPKGSKGMRWHIDTSLFSPDAIEGVITIDNNSPSEFNWMQGLLKKNIKPKSNTLALVKPGTVMHSVSGTEDGYRTIIKFVIDFKNSKPRTEFHKELKKCPF